MTDEKPKVTSEEEAQDLDMKIEQMRQMKTLAESDGWKHHVLPHIENNKKALFNGFRNAQKYEQFISAQQCYNALDDLVRFVNNVIRTGEEAFKRLHPDE